MQSQFIIFDHIEKTVVVCSPHDKKAQEALAAQRDQVTTSASAGRWPCR